MGAAGLRPHRVQRGHHLGNVLPLDQVDEAGTDQVRDPVAEEALRRGTLVAHGTVRVDHRDQVRGAVNQGPELRGLALPRSPQEQPHPDCGQRAHQAQRDPDQDHPQQRPLRVQGHLADRVVRGRGHESAKYPQLLEGRDVGVRPRVLQQELLPHVQQAPDQPTLLLELRGDHPVPADGRDGDLRVRTLDRLDRSTVQQRVRGVHELLRIGLGLRLDPPCTDQDVLDVALRQGPLPRGDVHDQGLVPFAVGCAGVVRDDRDDQDQERGDPHLEAPRGPQRPDDGGPAGDRSPPRPPEARACDAGIRRDGHDSSGNREGGVHPRQVVPLQVAEQDVVPGPKVQRERV